MNQLISKMQFVLSSKTATIYMQKDYAEAFLSSVDQAFIWIFQTNGFN